MYSFNDIYQYSKDLTILYVEDDKDLQNAIFDVLNDMFKNVVIANDGEDGLEKYQEQSFDLVITDINMPKMNGIELTKKIYEINEEQPIIIISAYDKSHYLLELINLGVEYFLKKPFENEDVLNVLYKICKKISEIKLSQKTIDSNIVQINKDIKYNTQTLELLYQNKPIKLTKKEMALIEILVKNKNKVSTQDEIFAKLWEENPYDASEDSLKSIISRFRKKVRGLKIENVYGLGYIIAKQK